MSYNRIATPRIYTDLLSTNIASGWSTLDQVSMLQNDNSTAVTFESGGKADIFDLRPSNFATIEKENQQFYIQIDTEFSSDSLAVSNYLAILGHNFNTADVVFKVEIDDDSAMGSPTIVSTTANHTKVINAAADATADWIDTAYDGWTLITWSLQTSDNRYIRITFEDDTGGAAANFDSDINIGAIMFGEYLDFPHSPDLAIKTTIDYDGTNLQTSIGGNTYSNSAYLSQPSWAASKAWQATTYPNYSFEERNGRLYHDLKFSYISDTDLFASNPYSNFWSSNSIHQLLYNRVSGQHLPFLFCIDNGSTSTGDYGLFRLDDSKLQATQVAHKMWDISLGIRETW